MAYEKHTWSCGETVTADLLNRMEDGIAEGGGGSDVLIINGTATPTQDQYTFTLTVDKTVDEVLNAEQSLLVCHIGDAIVYMQLATKVNLEDYKAVAFSGFFETSLALAAIESEGARLNVYSIVNQ